MASTTQSVLLDTNVKEQKDEKNTQPFSFANRTPGLLPSVLPLDFTFFQRQNPTDIKSELAPPQPSSELASSSVTEISPLPPVDEKKSLVSLSQPAPESTSNPNTIEAKINSSNNPFDFSLMNEIRAHLQTQLNSSSTARRMKQYLQAVLKQAPEATASPNAVTAWLADQRKALTDQIGKTLQLKEAAQLKLYFEQMHTRLQPTQPSEVKSPCPASSPTHSSASLFQPPRSLPPEITLSSTSPSGPISQSSLVFTPTLGKQPLQTFKESDQYGTLLWPHAKEKYTLRLIMHDPQHGTIQYNVSYLSSGNWVIWNSKPGTYYPSPDKRRDPFSEPAQAKLLDFITQQLPTLAKLNRFSTLPTLFLPDAETALTAARMS
jgi:hypothetical protein